MNICAHRCILFSWARNSLQRRFALIAAALLVVTSLVFLLVVTGVFRNRILAEHERASMNINLLLQAVLENAMIKRDLDGLQGIVARLGGQEEIRGVMIVNPAGEVRFSSYPEQMNRQLDDPGIAVALASQQQQSGFRQIAGGGEVLRSINPVHNQPDCKECHGTQAQSPVNGLLVVDYNSSELRSAVRNGAILLGSMGILVLLVVEGGLWVALRFLVLDRIGNLQEATEQIASGQLTARANQRGGDEVAQLGASFNSMADQLEQSVGELKASEQFLQALMDTIPDGVRVIDADFRIIMANAAYCDQIGTARDQVVGALCYVSSHNRKTPCMPTLVRCPVVEILQGDRTGLKCSHTHITRDGCELPVEVSAARATVDIDGKYKPCVVEAIRDLDTQLNISHEQRLSELAMLAAGVAHEVYNPLSSISLALQALGADPNQSESARQYIEIAEAEITNCQHFTESLLRLSTRSQGSPELVEMTKVVASTMALLSFEAERAGVQLQSDVQGNPRVLAGDSDMRTLVFNLTLNAIHAMPEGGRAGVSCKVAGGRVVLRISDTGVGIAERDQSKILLPFWTKRADGTRGRGLGLSICKSITDRLQGGISFETRVGHGTVFTIDLPDADEVTI